MSTKAISSEMCEVTVALPKDLLNRLAMAVPRRERNDFIARAIEEQLALEGQIAATFPLARPQPLPPARMSEWLIRSFADSLIRPFADSLIR